MIPMKRRIGLSQWRSGRVGKLGHRLPKMMVREVFLEYAN
jgi:hypothetical protein